MLKFLYSFASGLLNFLAMLLWVDMYLFSVFLMPCEVLGVYLGSIFEAPGSILRHFGAPEGIWEASGTQLKKVPKKVQIWTKFELQMGAFGAPLEPFGAPWGSTGAPRAAKGGPGGATEAIWGPLKNIDFP